MEEITSDRELEMLQTNEDFKHYVDEYCKAKNVTIKDALTHAIIKNVGDYYRRLNNATNKDS